MQPVLALGRLGKMQGVTWQVVGFQHRVGRPVGNHEDDESFGWSEYLLFNEQRGFSFLVDSEDGWSLLRPTSGAPQQKRSRPNHASYLGTSYRLKYSYDAETNYVAGEFYWPVQRGQKSFKPRLCERPESVDVPSEPPPS